MRIKLISLLAAGCLIGTNNIAFASGYIVFDPTNFGKNLITAGESVKQTAQMALQYKTMTDQYMTMLTNLKQLSPADVSSGVSRGVLPSSAIQAAGSTGLSSGQAINMSQGVYQNYNDLYNTMTGLSGTYSALQQYSMNMSRQSVQTGQSWKDIMALELSQAKQGQIASAKQFTTLQGLISQLTNFQTRADHLADLIPQNEGTMQMLGTISAQNHLVSDQLSGILQASAAQAQNSSNMARDSFVQREKMTNEMDSAKRRQESMSRTFNLPSTK